MLTYAFPLYCSDGYFSSLCSIFSRIALARLMFRVFAMLMEMVDDVSCTSFLRVQVSLFAAACCEKIEKTVLDTTIFVSLAIVTDKGTVS